MKDVLVQADLPPHSAFLQAYPGQNVQETDPVEEERLILPVVNS